MKFLVSTLLYCLSLAGTPALAQESCSQLFFASGFFNNEKSWVLQSLESEFRILEDFFVKNKDLSDDIRIQKLLDQDLRKSFFRFQALSRMLEIQNPEFFAAKRLQFKKLEDAIGKMGLMTSLRKTAEMVGEPEIVQIFARKEAKAKEKILLKMKSSGLWNEPAMTLRALKEQFEKEGHWRPEGAESKFLLAMHAEHVTKLHAAIKANKFENPDIEKGLHELRRRLRWTLLQVVALEGIVTLNKEDGNSPEIRTWFEQLKEKDPEFLQFHYFKNQEVRVTQPLQIPLHEFAIINKLVKEIGDLKDKAEMEIYFTQAIDQLASGSAQKNKVLQKLNQFLGGQHVDHQAVAREIQLKLVETSLLQKYVERLESLNMNVREALKVKATRD